MTIPKSLREPLGLAAGDSVAFSIAADQSVVLIKLGGDSSASRIEALRARAGPGLSTDEIMALTRGE